MKDIRFRVWDKKGRRWISPNVTLDYSGLLNWQCGYESKLIDDAENYDVQLSTGHRDKRGTLIYEGDIVHYKLPSDYSDGYDITLPVEWDGKGTGFSPLNGWHIVDNGNIDDNTIPNSKLEFEIIGNICENPELLGDAQKTR